MAYPDTLTEFNFNFQEPIDLDGKLDTLIEGVTNIESLLQEGGGTEQRFDNLDTSISEIQDSLTKLKARVFI